MRKLCLLISAMFFLLLTINAQERTITGKVTDEQGGALPNVTIIAKGTNIGTATADDGTYSITIPTSASQLEFSSVNYATTIVNIGTRRNVGITLVTAETKELTGVVVTGISRVKKSEFTGAATRIDERQLENRPFGSFDQALQGQAPGITVLTGSGAPGTAANVIIRGTNSIQGTSDPLYVIDGIPVEKNTFQGYNTNDFSSIEVLRDASAAALYGSRGSGGVIVATTKRGSAGRMRLGYTAQMGIKSRPEFAFKTMNTQQLLRAQEDLGRTLNQPGSPFPGSPVLPGWFYSTNNPRFTLLAADSQARVRAQYDSISAINTNWSDEIFRQGTFSNHEISLSGGSGKTRLYSSLAFYKEEGTSLRTDMKRGTLRTNVDHLDDKFTFRVSSNLAYTNRNFQQSTVTNSLGNPFLTSAVNVPYAKVRNDDGSFATGNDAQHGAANQLELTDLDRNYNNQIKGTLGITASYNITKSVILGLTSGLDFRETQGTNFGNKAAFVRSNPNVTNPTIRSGFQTESLTRFLTSDFRPSIGYKKLFREKHDIDISVYGEHIKEFGKFFSLTGYGTDPRIPNTPATIIQGNGDNLLFANVTGRKAETTLLSGLITGKYTFQERYTLSGSFRNDGSSKLPEANRWQTFFSVGGVWEITKENFMSNVRPVNLLRVKASYGSSGNSNNFPSRDETFYLSAYPNQSSYSLDEYSGLPTQEATYPGNPDLKWETTYMTNVGLDFEIFNRRVYGDLNWYNKLTKNLFLQKSISATSGFPNFSLDVNAGQLSNKGFEWNVSGEVIRKKDVVWTLFANGGYNRNRVKSLGGEKSFDLGTERITEGLPLGSHYEIEWAGVDAATGQPLYYDSSGAVVPNAVLAAPVQKFGTWEAPWRGGFGSTLRYKGFDLSVLFSWQRGATKVDNLEFFVENPVGFLQFGYNQSSDLKFWQQPGDVVNTPSPQYGTSFSSKLIHNSSFLRFRDITLAYSLPGDMLRQLKYISRARLFIQATNLFIWTNWRGRDPEGGATNINLSEYPNPRGITAGLEITF